MVFIDGVLWLTYSSWTPIGFWSQESFSIEVWKTRPFLGALWSSTFSAAVWVTKTLGQAMWRREQQNNQPVQAALSNSL